MFGTERKFTRDSGTALKQYSTRQDTVGTGNSCVQQHDSTGHGRRWSLKNSCVYAGGTHRSRQNTVGAGHWKNSCVYAGGTHRSKQNTVGTGHSENFCVYAGGTHRSRQNTVGAGHWKNSCVYAGGTHRSKQNTVGTGHSQNSCVYAGGNTQKQSTRGEEHGRNFGNAVLYIHGRYTQEANALTHPNTLRRSRQCPWYNPTFSRQGLHINQSLCSSFLPGAQNQPINIAL